MAAPGHEVAVTHLIGNLRLHIQGYVGHENFSSCHLRGVMSCWGEGYLVLEDWPIETPDERPVRSQACSDVVDNKVDCGIDFATVCQDDNGAHFFTYHIIYNDIYRVPKLLLRGRYSDGKPIEWQDVLQMLPAGLSNGNTKWTYLTHEEHPYLRMPWFALHPCGTSEFMGMVFSTSSVDCHQSDNNVSLPVTHFYTLAWLSFVSQAAALRLPKGFSQCFNLKRRLNSL
ncbi:hypothetical protein L7F22_031571 [Adiantum nelumboides]|nr:hypothetical protein [Adiantum nelumboides]